MKRKRSTVGIALDKLMEMPAIQTLKAERERERVSGLTPGGTCRERPPEGPYEAVNIIVDCPICRHRFGFINARQAQLKKADMRRALVSWVGRAIHKFLD